MQKLARKHNEAMLTIQQYPAQIDPEIRAGVSQFAVFKIVDDPTQLEAAAQMLRRPGDPEVLDTLPGLPTGRFFFADLAGRVGVVQGQLAPFAPIRDAVDTSVRVEVVA
jgi:hypothetical protein